MLHRTERSSDALRRAAEHRSEQHLAKEKKKRTRLEVQAFAGAAFARGKKKEPHCGWHLALRGRRRRRAEREGRPLDERRQVLVRGAGHGLRDCTRLGEK